MYPISCDLSVFAARDWQEALSVADRLQIPFVETETFSGKTLEQCSGAEVEDLRSSLIDHNKMLVLLTTRLPLSDLRSYNELFRKAHLLHVSYVRIASESMTEAPAAEETAEILKMAAAWNIGILWENHHASFFNDDAAMTKFLRSLPETAEVIYNPAEFVALSHHPFFHMFYGSKLKNRIRFLRLNDSLYSTGEPRALAQGNSEIKELISILLARSYDGFFSVTPYLDGTAETMEKTLEEYRNLLKNL